MKLSSRFAIVCSTSGSVMEYALTHDMEFRGRVKLVITDRSCSAENVAERFGIKCVRIDISDSLQFSGCLEKLLIDYSIDVAFFFFTRIIKGNILEKFSCRLVNFHPSLLPAFSGLNGFDDGWNSTSLLLGSTVHLIDTGVDTGPIVQQSFISINRSLDIKSVVRHKIFLQQCASLLQVSDWFAKGRVVFNTNGDVAIQGGEYDSLDGFIPALEKVTAINMAAESPM